MPPSAIISNLVQFFNLVLLDAPDTHVNPQWSWEYPEMLIDEKPAPVFTELLPVSANDETRPFHVLTRF
jgi:hypothetical protein